MAQHLHAVAVFGAPQPGDADFAGILEDRLPGGCVRCQHAADMVCSLPNDPEYRPCGSLLFIASDLGGPPAAR